MYIQIHKLARSGNIGYFWSESGSVGVVKECFGVSQRVRFVVQNGIDRFDDIDPFVGVVRVDIVVLNMAACEFRLVDMPNEHSPFEISLE